MIEKLPDHIKVDREYEDLKDKLNEIIDVVNTIEFILTKNANEKLAELKPCDHKWVTRGVLKDGEWFADYEHCELCGEVKK